MTSIDSLKKRVDENRDWRSRSKAEEERINARRILVDAEPNEQDMDFYCETCEVHESCKGKKVIVYGIELDSQMNVIGDYEAQPLRASFVAHCKRGHPVRRFITDKEQDPYFQSPIVRRLQILMEDDLLQPDHPRFKQVYPKQWAELEKQKEENERMGAFSLE